MYDLLFSGSAAWFSIPAILGTLFFIIRLGLMSMGMIDLDAHTDGGGDFHGGDLHGGDLDGLDGADADGADAHHTDSNALFRHLSVQSVFTFAMGFGWGALASSKGTGWSIPVSIAVGAVCGVAMVYLLTLLLTMLYDLRSDGTLHIRGAIGLEGDAYAQVPPSHSGKGQVSVVIETRQRIYNAVTGDAEAIPSGMRVRVLGTKDGNTLDVTGIRGGG